MPSTLRTLIGRPVGNVFRRAMIKRRNTSDGKFESVWYDVTEFVKRWGSVEAAVDDVRLNRFTHSGLTLTMRNDTGAFAVETQNSSLWNGFLTRYRTLVKVEGGYYDEDGGELPTDTSLGVFVLSGEIPISQVTNEAVLNCRSLVSVFDEVRAAEVAGLGSTQTASQIMAKIRDHTDGAGNFVFREFITSTSWLIQSTTINYNLATTGSIGLMTTWELMNQIAESEGFILLVTRQGGIEFRDREVRTTTSNFVFYGQGFAEQNIIALPETKEPLDRFFNYFRLKWRTEDTTTSYVTAGQASSVDPSNTSWKYGARVYDFENDFFASQTTAQTVVDGLFNIHAGADVRLEGTFVTKFNPLVEVSDQVEVNYHSYGLAGAALWDSVDWDGFDWDSEEGDAIDWNDKRFRVLGRRTDLENFTTTLRLQEV